MFYSFAMSKLGKKFKSETQPKNHKLDIVSGEKKQKQVLSGREGEIRKYSECFSDPGPGRMSVRNPENS